MLPLPAFHRARRPRRTLSIVAASVLAFALAGCGTAPTASPTASGPAPSPPPPSATPSGTPRPSTEVLLAEVRDAVSEIRGLEPTGEVEPTIIDESTLRANLEAEFDAEYTAEELAVIEGIYIALGLLPENASLRELQLDLLGGQVVGYYSPDRDELFVVSRDGPVGPVERSTYAHEFVHQLQDQHFDLGDLGLDMIDEGDRALAVLSLIEGDATAAQSTWMQAALTPEEIGEIFLASLDPEGLEALARAPAILREIALFPYQAGLVLVTALITQGGYQAVDAAYASPPASTEQVIHPEKYLADEAPLEVVIPDRLAGRIGSGWSEAGQDTLGEFLLRVWLVEGGIDDPGEAAVAAAGWGGDRLALLRGPDGELAIALVTEWDSPADAAEFAAAARSAISGLGLDGRIVEGLAPTRVTIAIGDAVAELAEALAE